MRRAIMVVLDGLRRDFVTEATTPRLMAFVRQAEYFQTFRSAFPSATRIVSATFATGCFPARHTLQGNAVALLEDGVLVAHDVGRPDFLLHKKAVTGQSLAVPTLAERLAPHGGAIIFNNVSPGAARAHDPDGFGHVYHRAFSVGPGSRPVDDPLRVTLDAAGDRAMTDRFIERSHSPSPAGARRAVVRRTGPHSAQRAARFARASGGAAGGRPPRRHGHRRGGARAGHAAMTSC